MVHFGCKSKGRRSNKKVSEAERQILAHVVNSSKLDALCGDDSTLRDHQLSVFKDIQNGRFSNPSKVMGSIKELTQEQQFESPRILDDVLFISNRLINISAVEIETLCRLYGVSLVPWEIDLLFKIRSAKIGARANV
ncbi:Tellurite resistance protein TerB [Vibrio crassostreae]|uniref:Uncharacterized protein n=1 Tax=Vibrio crassostreae TaxID=246167 RepID=A0A4R2FT94_9VIBR|nr:hypothetical protein [Vibrio crassostreae]CAH6958818.1 conserved hypothetical protein [Vibrio chagasii]TCN06131.1 hypothetical protein EDB35_114110 [Vibrio crassostreae]TCN95799.1 hypothetical protein EDB51_117116 [Vibrio crassostreae]TCU05458.1 hypothetical protein EDB32_11645 [Vibrio crassostreae]CAH7287535.1 conserved hypothetical protein [Vibrio chagasii]